MRVITVEDFYEQAAAVPRLTREEEVQCAQAMRDGNADARARLIEGYLPMVAAHIRHSGNLQSLALVYSCCAELEKGVDKFNFFQESETFSHHLSWRLRQCTARYIADR